MELRFQPDLFEGDHVDTQSGPDQEFNHGVEDALGKMRPTIAACKSQFRILKRVLIEKVTFRGHVLYEPRTLVRAGEAKRLWLAASKGEAQ